MSIIMTDRGWQQLEVVCVNHNDLQGVYRGSSSLVASSSMMLRAENYARDVNAYIAGDLPKEQIFRAFDAPVFGAFGEKL